MIATKFKTSKSEDSEEGDSDVNSKDDKDHYSDDK